MQYLGENPSKNNHAGNKARIDIDSILYNRYGKSVAEYEEISLKNAYERIVYYSQYRVLRMLYRLTRVKFFSLVVQYPVYTVRSYRKKINALFDNNDVILLIHDIKELRYQNKGNLIDIISKYNMCKAIIVHNEKMRGILIENGLKVPSYSIELFDYLLDGDLPKNKFSLGNEIVFAGNLAKSAFLLDEKFERLKLKFNLYGPGISFKVQGYENVSYEGSFAPNDVPYKLKGSFGLIWDGDSVDTCTGELGEYMRYNNPHKLSLYIAAGLPVVVWKESAVADFVKEHGIGICVDSLQEISLRIGQLDKDDYQCMLDNIVMEQKKLVAGYYTNRVLDEIEKSIIN